MVSPRPSSPPIRVVVADDSALARQLLRDLLDADPDIEVVGVASNGAEAVALVERLRPSIVTMDLRMPGMDGLAAAAAIMRAAPTPVLLVTSSDFRLRQRDVFDSFRFGIVDVLEKPALTEDGCHSPAARILLEKVKILSRIKVAPLRTVESSPGALPLGGRPASRPPSVRVIGIGASTGGPRALPVVLGALPSTLAVPVLIAQHMSGPFVPAFVEWLADESPLPVSVARDGDRPLPGRVLVAPGGQNMVVDGGGVVRLNDDDAPAGIRPSVDLLFESLARTYGAGAVGVVLTGIGRDGTEGLRAIRRAAGVTLAQDAASCVVAGMPGAAVSSGVVDAQVELAILGKTLGDLVAGAARPAAPDASSERSTPSQSRGER